MMEISSLAHIINVPATPMPLFAQWFDEAKKFSDPKTFLNNMCLASHGDDDEILNRNVLMKKHDDNGWVFVTERNSMKYKNFIKYPRAAVTFIWNYHMQNGTVITRQVRAIGKVIEVSEEEIAEFYKNEILHSKIRSKICRCGEPVVWDELKASHDKVLHEYRNGTDALERGPNYTAMRIIAEKVDFYHGETNLIADRIEYTLENDIWTNHHLAA